MEDDLFFLNGRRPNFYKLKRTLFFVVDAILTNSTAQLLSDNLTHTQTKNIKIINIIGCAIIVNSHSSAYFHIFHFNSVQLSWRALGGCWRSPN